MEGLSLSLLLVVFLGALPTAGASEELEGIFRRIEARAAEKSFEIRLASEAAEQASAQSHTAWTRWIPRLDLVFTQTRTKDYSFLTSGSLGALTNTFAITPQASSLSRWELDLTAPVYRRTVHAGLEQAFAESALARRRFELRKGELDWRLRSLVGQYILQRYKEAAILNSIEIARKNLREAELSFELGNKTRIDVLRAKSNLLTLRSRHLSYRQEENAALNALVEYSGISARELIAEGLNAALGNEENLARAIDGFTRIDHVLPKLSAFLDEKGEPSIVETQISRASPAYAVTVAEEESMLARAGLMTAEQFPYLDLRGALNKQAPEWSSAFGSDNVSYSAGLILTIPLFSGGSLFSTHAEKAHARKSGQIKAEQDLLRLRDGIENDRIQIRTLLSSLEAQRVTREQNEEILRLSQKSYQLGKSTMVELLSAQNDLIDSKVNLAKTKIDLAVLSRKLAWNLGVPLE